MYVIKNLLIHGVISRTTLGKKVLNLNNYKIKLNDKIYLKKTVFTVGKKIWSDFIEYLYKDFR